MSLDKDLDAIDPEKEELRRALVRSQAAYAKLKKSRDDFTEAVVIAAHDAMLSLGPVPPIPIPEKDKRKAKAEVALFHSTDWQLGKRTVTYNSKECERLVHQSADKTIQLTNIQRKDHPVREIYILFGGDILENSTIFPSQSYEIGSDVMVQFDECCRIMYDMIRKFLANFDKVTAVFEEGNHGRMGKFGELPKHINWDKLIYKFVTLALKGEKRFVSQMSNEDIKRVHIPDPTGKSDGYKALLIHGDEIRWGTASTIVRFADRWASGAYKFFDEVDEITKGYDFRDLYIGHYHQHQAWNMANGEGSVYMTGSTESSNAYARDLLAANGMPSQRLHFISPEAGRVTGEHRLWLH